MTPEGRVKSMVKKALDGLDADCWRFMPVQTGYGTVALDYLLCIKGKFVVIETKAPGKKLTPLQEGTKAAMEAAGALVFVVWDERSLDIAMGEIFLHTGANNVGRNQARLAKLSAQAQGQDQQHLRQQQQAKTFDGAIGGHHGAPRTPPQRQPEPRSREHDQKSTVDLYGDGHGFRDTWRK